MNYLFENYPEHSLSLDVNAESDQAVNFYIKNGLRIHKVYTTPEPDNVEFALFETPLDKKAKKLDVKDPEFEDKSIQQYFSTIEEYHSYHSPTVVTEESSEKDETEKSCEKDETAKVELAYQNSNESTENDSPVKQMEVSAAEWRPSFIL